MKSADKNDVLDIFQSTLSMRRATEPDAFVHDLLGISIHALHEESDTRGLVCCRVPGISIHALHEESDCRSKACRPDP